MKCINDELSGGARINYIFNDIFKKAIFGLDPFEYLNDQVEKLLINNLTNYKGNQNCDKKRQWSKEFLVCQ